MSSPFSINFGSTSLPAPKERAVKPIPKRFGASKSREGVDPLQGEVPILKDRTNTPSKSKEAPSDRFCSSGEDSESDDCDSGVFNPPSTSRTSPIGSGSTASHQEGPGSSAPQLRPKDPTLTPTMFSPGHSSSSSGKGSSSRSNPPTNASSNTGTSELGGFEDEFDLLGGDDIEEGPTHEVITAPLITRDAFAFGEGLLKVVPQYGVLGSILSVHEQGRKEEFADKRMYLNTNAPFSAVVCGVQGSGKSHTVGVLLESMMIPNDTRLGALPQPLAGLVLHFGESGAGAQPCEAAYQCTSNDPKVNPPKVVVYVSPSQLKTMGNLYWSVFGNNVRVRPLKIEHDELDAQSILSMMSVSTSGEPPLYVQIILTLLRDLGEEFNYTEFKRQLDIKAKDFNPAQVTGYKQRISLLESFVTKEKTRTRFKAGQLTIIDLTDPFIDRAGACSLFEIVTRLFIRAKVDSGKVLVVDEAHKYLTRDKGSHVLTGTLLSIVRQQRHLGTRLIMSTQEPTVIPPALLDLCSITIMHRFSSVGWFEHLAKHVSSDFGSEAFDSVTGEAIVLAPGGLGVFNKPRSDSEKPERYVTTFGRRYLLLKTRKRVTADGGASILAIGRSP
ncbi:hypothetical protein M407DRAFT_31200 [Tulasnella calospora MUT 4182]|uniref:Zona occludens toxin N-terminal domain-containing protein n=1 Tax=Tulasnella calospora MUT 4182 TaxID=1051891 RepID=A0A0C3KCG6_9AGAM|nr:hypothetical protein M407DRAFT_31200 [Tulasnella calospora MUT 4182]